MLLIYQKRGELNNLRSLTYIKLLSIIGLHCSNLSAQLSVAQEVFAIRHLYLQLLFQWQIEQLDSFFNQIILDSQGQTCVLSVEETNINDCSSQLL